MVKKQASIWTSPLRAEMTECLLPVLTSCLIPSTDTVAFARRFPSTSLTTPLMPRCTCGSHDQHFLRLCRCLTSYSLEIEILHPSTFWLWVSATMPHRDLICMCFITCSMKASRASRLFSHSDASSLSCGNLSHPRKMEISKQLVCR